MSKFIFFVSFSIFSMSVYCCENSMEKLLLMKKKGEVERLKAECKMLSSSSEQYYCSLELDSNEDFIEKFSNPTADEKFESLWKIDEIVSGLPGFQDAGIVNRIMDRVIEIVQSEKNYPEACGALKNLYSRSDGYYKNDLIDKVVNKYYFSKIKNCLSRSIPTLIEDMKELEYIE